MRALFTYWRHFLRRSPHSVASSAARSMARVETGWIAGAGRQPAARERARDRAALVRPRVALDLGVDPEMAHPARPGSPAAQAVAGELREPPIVSSVPALEHGAARGIGEGPRQRPRAAERGPGPRRVPSRSRRADQPLTALTRAQPSSWRYDPSGFASTNASQAAGVGRFPGGDRGGRRRLPGPS